MRPARTFCAVVLATALAAVAPAQETRTDQGSATDVRSAPRLAIEEVVHDFGELKPGVPLRWVFRIKNVGNADLLIRGVKPG